MNHNWNSFLVRSYISFVLINIIRVCINSSWIIVILVKSLHILKTFINMVLLKIFFLKVVVIFLNLLIKNLGCYIS